MLFSQQRTQFFSRRRAGAMTLAGLMLSAGVASPALAQESGESEMDQVTPGEKWTVSLGYDFSSHFMSYGDDVWGAGDDLFGQERTNFAWADFVVDAGPIDLNFGAWGDINDNATSGLGGEIQEIDVYAGASMPVDDFTLSATYQEWYYGADEERIVDLGVSYDDTGLIAEDFALNPSFTAHFRVDGNGAQDEAQAYVFGISPSFQLTEGSYPLTLGIPANVAYVSENFDTFNGQAAGDSGMYANIGASLSMPLSFIPEGYGDWTGSATGKYWYADEDAYPGNPEETFPTAMFSISTTF
jgi:hypothetical protein